jgi:tetratricopeptide (TPR) repeat protein
MTQPSLCPDPRRLRDLLAGRGSFPDVEVFAHHLEGCPVCAREAQRVRAEDPLAELVRGHTPAGFDDVEPEVARLIESLCRRPAPAPEATAADGGHPCPLLAGVLGIGDTVWDSRGALSPPERPGELGRLGGYRVVGVLGTGGMGVVYLARQARPDRLVALKVIGGGPRADRGRLARFRAEAEVAARLTHPNIVSVFEAGEHDGLPFLAMEYVAGGSLAQKLARGTLRPREAASLITSLARAVGYAHSHGIVHRDLKPSNILLAVGSGRWVVGSPEGTHLPSSLPTAHCPLPTSAPKVTDFGLAKLLDPDTLADPARRTETGALLGTPCYMAPEQAAGDSVGPAADVYGLGAILYECITGRPPFTAATVLETIDQVRTHDPIPPDRLQPAVPRDLQTVCLKCLEKDPARRYASADDLADDLDRFLRGEPVKARPIGIAGRSWKWARRRPTVAALLALCVMSVVALAAVIAVYTVRLRQAASDSAASAAEARRQQSLAANNYRSARDALRRMLRRLDDRRAADIPRLKELRQDQLEDALAFYEGALAGLDDPDPAVRLDAAIACAEFGTLQCLLGRTAPARENFGRAVAMLEQLPTEYRTRPDCRCAVIHCVNYLADLSGNAEMSEALFRKGLAEAEELVRADPSDPLRRTALAGEEHNLGSLFQLRGHRDRAEPHYLRAIEIRTALIDQNPQADGYRADLAEDLLNLGLIYLQTERRAMAAEAFGKAEGLLRPLREAHPADDRYALSLAGLYINWGNLLRFSGDLSGAMAKYNRAVELADGVLDREPQYRTARDRATEAHGSRAFLLAAVGRSAAAIPDWDVVLQFVEGPARASYRAYRAIGLATGGRHTLAAAEAHELATMPEIVGDDRYNLACVLALVVEPTRANPACGALVAIVAAEAHAVTAVGLLRQLHAAGYFRRPEALKLFNTDLHLTSLRARPDFRQLRQEIAGGTKP